MAKSTKNNAARAKNKQYEIEIKHLVISVWRVISGAMAQRRQRKKKKYRVAKSEISNAAATETAATAKNSGSKQQWRSMAAKRSAAA